MKKISFLLILLLVAFLSLKFTTYIYAKASLSNGTPLKVTLINGYKGEFCEVENTSTSVNVLGATATLESGEDLPCIPDIPKKEIIVGDVLINYAEHYNGNETFFIIDDKMYRAGDKFYSYYEDLTKGGKVEDGVDKSVIEGLQYTGSQFFFESEYKNTAAESSLVENSNYTKRFSEDGKDVGAIIVFKGKKYKRLEILKELENEVLVEYPAPSEEPSPTLDPLITLSPTSPSEELYVPVPMITYDGKVFSFQHPNYLVFDNSSTDDFIGFLQKQDDLMARRLSILVFNKYVGMDISDVLRGENFGDTSSFTKFDTTIDGKRAQIITQQTSLQELCGIPNTTSIQRTKYAFIDSGTTTLLFIPNDSCDTYKTDWFSKVPYSVRFK